MKIGFEYNIHNIHLGENKYERLKEVGFSCIDFSMVDTEDSLLYYNNSAELQAYFSAQRQAAEAAGIEISQVHGPWRYPPRDFTEADRAERLEKMQISLHNTAVLGCKNWVIHPIMPYGTDDLNSDNIDKTLDLNLEFMHRLLLRAKGYGITVCLENMPFRRFSVSKPTEILKVVKLINDEHFKICLDTGHVNVFEGLNPGDAVRELGGYIKTLHIHDNDGKADSHLLPGMGNIDWKAFAAALKEIGFSGAFSFEAAPPRSLPENTYFLALKAMTSFAEEIMK